MEFSPRKSDYPKYMSRDQENFRGVHAIGLLTDKKGHTLDNLITLAHDPYLPAFKTLIPKLLKAYDSIPSPFAGEDSTICSGESVTLDIGTANATSYQWQGGPSTAQWTVSAPGQYIGEASNICGIGRDTVIISRLDDPNINLGPDLLLCDRDSLVIDYSSQAWQFSIPPGTQDR